MTIFDVLERINLGYEMVTKKVRVAGLHMINNEEMKANTHELYNVVISVEDQYSIWPVRKEIPFGWSNADKTGTKEECLAYIKEVWTDMRPRSLKEQMAKTEKNSQ